MSIPSIYECGHVQKTQAMLWTLKKLKKVTFYHNFVKLGH